MDFQFPSNRQHSPVVRSIIGDAVSGVRNFAPQLSATQWISSAIVPAGFVCTELIHRIPPDFTILSLRVRSIVAAAAAALVGGVTLALPVASDLPLNSQVTLMVTALSALSAMKSIQLILQSKKTSESFKERYPSFFVGDDSIVKIQVLELRERVSLASMPIVRKRRSSFHQGLSHTGLTRLLDCCREKACHASRQRKDDGVDFDR